MAIFTSKIHEKIINELKRREEANASPTTSNLESISQYPFIILESNAVQIIDPSSEARTRTNDNRLASENVLFGGDSKNITSGDFNSLHDDTTNLGIRPLSGINSISVKNKGTLGAVREATINFQCWSTSTLDTMQKLYMNPGVYLFLQWGFYTSSNKIHSIFSSKPGEEILNLLKKDIIHNMVIASNGNYDAMVGPCSKFSWKLNSSGGFDCTTTIISPASFVYSMPMNSSEISNDFFSDWISGKYIAEISGMAATIIQKIKLLAVQTDLALDAMDARLASIVMDARPLNTNKKPIDYSKSKLITKKPTKILPNAINLNAAAAYLTSDTKNIDANLEAFFANTYRYYKYLINNSNTYISFGHLCTLINTCKLYTLSEMFSDNIEDYINASIKPNFGNYIPKQKYIDNNIVHIDLSSSNSICKNYKYLKSNNPTEVLIVNVDGLSDSDTTRFTSKYGENVKYLDFNIDKPSDSAYQDISAGNFRYGDIKKIYISTDSISKIITDDATVSDIIDKILNLINTSVSNFFHLVRDNDPNDPLVIQIVDTELSTKKEPIPVFSTYSLNTVLHNVSLDAMLPNKFQAAAYIGNTSGNLDSTVSPFYNFNYGFRNPLTEKAMDMLEKKESDARRINATREYSNTLINQGKDNEVAKKYLKEIDDTSVASKIKLAIKLAHDEYLKLEIDSTDISKYEKEFFHFIKQAAKVKEVSIIGAPIGASLKVSMRGISGIYYGNLFNINYTPNYIKETVCFQTTDVEHVVDSSGWNVTLNSILRETNNSEYISISEPLKIVRPMDGSNGYLTDDMLTKVDDYGHRLSSNGAAEAFKKMVKDAADEKIIIEISEDPITAYRTYDQQVDAYRTLERGQAALPGTSKHGLGLAVDIAVFGRKGVPEWLKKNGEKYGWSRKENYPKPWHFEYFGGV